MNEENQNIEWKENWRDEFLKWICGFANAQGGKIYIGVNDKGVVSGLVDTKNLLVEIPNKTKDFMGILVDVNLKKKADKKYLEIIVDAYPNPISYKGIYYYRNGSTKQELKGAALDKFILQKQGKHWDAVPLPNLAPKDLSTPALDYFKLKAANTNRVSLKVLKEKMPQLLEKLHLKADSIYWKRATALLFYHDPEKYVTGAYVKIGFFNSDDDLAYQDEVHGHLFDQVEKTIDLLQTKYLKATITYKGINRLETFAVPPAALREALLNAIVHKDYSSGNPIQISVYSNKLIIWNAGQLPNNWTIAKLKIKHPSQPNNPDIANCFFRAGLIEAWGRGTLKIINECKLAKVDLPVFDNEQDDFSVTFTYKKTLQSVSKLKANATTAEKVLHLIVQNNNVTISELAAAIGVAERTIKRVMNELQGSQKIVRLGSKKMGSWKVIDNT